MIKKGYRMPFLTLFSKSLFVFISILVGANENLIFSNVLKEF